MNLRDEKFRCFRPLGARRPIIHSIVLIMVEILFSGQELLAWTLGTPKIYYWGQNTAYPNSSVGQTLQYDLDGGYNLIWDSTDATLAEANVLGLSALTVDPAFWQYHLGDLTNTAKKAYIDGQIASLNSTKIVNGNPTPVYPSFYGYFLGDEYPATNFPAMGELVTYLKTADPNHATYANISGLPGEITSQQQVADYQAYLSEFLTTVNPSFFSYDYYQLINSFSGTTYIGPADLNGYLMNLGLVSAAAHQNGIPFINVVQAFRYNAGVRTPNANELQYLVYSTLAYGAQGICYYTWDNSDYTAPLPGQPYYDGDTNVGAIEPLSWNPLIPSGVYTELTPLNHDFLNIATQLQPLNWVGAYLQGYSNSPTLGYLGPPGTAPLPVTAPFSVVGLSNNLQFVEYAAVKGVLVGLFSSNESGLDSAQYALVQNLDYDTNHTYSLAGPGPLFVFDAPTGTWAAVGGDQVTLDLPAGGGVLIRAPVAALPAAPAQCVFRDNFETAANGSRLGPPQIGSYVYAPAHAGTDALVSNARAPGPHGVTNYLSLDRSGSPLGDVVGGLFSTPVPVGQIVHFEMWAYLPSSPSDSQFAFGLGDTIGVSTNRCTITVWPSFQGIQGAVTLFDGNASYYLGLATPFDRWSKYEIDYTVGSPSIKITVNHQSVTTNGFLLPAGAVSNFWAYAAGDQSYVDDVLAWSAPTLPDLVFRDDFEQKANATRLGPPEIGSYLYAPNHTGTDPDVLENGLVDPIIGVSSPGTSSGTNCALLYRNYPSEQPYDVVGGYFSSPAQAGDVVHLEMWTLTPSRLFGPDATPGDVPQFTFGLGDTVGVSGNKSYITSFPIYEGAANDIWMNDGNAWYDLGLPPNSLDCWEKWEIDCLVGQSTNLARSLGNTTVTLNNHTVVADGFLVPYGPVNGFWMYAAATGFYVDEIQAWIQRAGVPAVPVITPAWSNSKLILFWYGGTLQSATAISGPYTDIPGAASPWTITPAAPQEYFRVRQ
jgi:hypothetical protein